MDPYRDLRLATLAYMAKYRLSQPAMAQRLDCAQATVQRWCIARNSIPSQPIMERLTALLQGDGLIRGMALAKPLRHYRAILGRAERDAQQVGRPLTAIAELRAMLEQAEAERQAAPARQAKKREPKTGAGCAKKQ